MGVFAARGRYVLFLDGDDELAQETVERSYTAAQEQQADLVGFGVEIIAVEGAHPKRFEASLQHIHPYLEGEEILPALFPTGKPAQSRIWSYLWSCDLLRATYEKMPADAYLPRANDFPVAFVGSALASRYISLTDKLYKYYFRRGGSGKIAVDTNVFEFYLHALDSIDVVDSAVDSIIGDAIDDDKLLYSFDSARLSLISNILRYWLRCHPLERAHCLTRLLARMSSEDVLRASSQFFPDVLSELMQHKEILTSHSHAKSSHTHQPHEAKNILLFVGSLGSGGVQAVVVSQAKALTEAGFNVVIAVRSLEGLLQEVPVGVTLVETAGSIVSEELSSFQNICEEYHIDMVIDHWLLYREDWPFFALFADFLNIRTIGWLHSFALRPVFDGNLRMSFLTKFLPLLHKVVCLSETDVAFWKTRGLDNVVYLPNPAESILVTHGQRQEPRELQAGPLRLVWWGRLQERTKRVRELVTLASDLDALDVDFQLRIIGPESKDLSFEKLQELIEENHLGDRITLTGPRHDDELLREIENSDLCVNTSAIEGYLLTLVEAQSMGLPVAMYELPWLLSVQDNQGIMSVGQGEHLQLAEEISKLTQDPARYLQLSAASLKAAARAVDHDFKKLYTDLIRGTLDPQYSPELTLDMATLLLERSIDYQEQGASMRNRQRNDLAQKLSKERTKVERLTQRKTELQARLRAKDQDLQRVRAWV